VKIVTCAILAVLAPALSSAQRISQRAESADHAREKEVFATRECLSKAGLGLVSSRDGLVVIVDSAKNEVFFNRTETWVGLDASKPEIAVFFEGSVWSPPSLPERFDLSKAVVLSFESDKVRFFDFRSMSGGYYRRHGK
jgi:hypothetical protein